jgi:orotidine-5'-phosphate decarboxylase
MPDRPPTPSVGASFADRVAAAVARTAPLCAGIDPSAAQLAAWRLPDTPVGLAEFGHRCVEAFAGTVAVVKPQVAFFERHGSAGVAALETVLAAARSAGLLCIADAKRGDIGTTMDAYAAAWLDPDSPLVADAVTVAPYLGLAALWPAVALASSTGRGVVVVARSSNPEGRPLQEARMAGAGGGADASVEDALLGGIAAWNRDPRLRPGTVGAVVGATLDPSAFDLGQLGGVILAPGLGAQGGTAQGAARLFGGCPAGTVLPSTSRSLLDAGPDVRALAEAARVTGAELRAALG